METPPLPFCRSSVVPGKVQPCHSAWGHGSSVHTNKPAHPLHRHTCTWFSFAEGRGWGRPWIIITWHTGREKEKKEREWLISAVQLMSLSFAKAAASDWHKWQALFLRTRFHPLAIRDLAPAASEVEICLFFWNYYSTAMVSTLVTELLAPVWTADDSIRQITVSPLPLSSPENDIINSCCLSL